jgi:hypothetical protein
MRLMSNRTCPDHPEYVGDTDPADPTCGECVEIWEAAGLG